MALLQATYEVSRLAGGQLKVIEEVEAGFGLLLLLCGLIPLLFFLYRMYKTQSLFPAWGILLFACPALFAAAMVSRTGSLTLDKAANTALFHRPVWFWHSDILIPLSTVRRAEVRNMRSSDYIAIVLDDGEAMSFADSSQEGGKGEAVEAINRYIASTAR